MTVHKVVPLPDNADLKRQALEVPGTKRPGQTGTRKIRLGPGRSQIKRFCLPAHYRNGTWRFSCPHLYSQFPPAIFGYIDLSTPDALTTLLEVFDSGYALSKDLTFLGHRPVTSKNPLKYADHYIWQTYAQVDERRRNLGSAIHALFENGTVGGGELPTVGLWSPNRPGKSHAHCVICSFTHLWLLIRVDGD